MPTLGSVSGTYGYGRSPQTLPPPGFTYRTPTGTTAPTWSLTTGPFVLSGNTIDSRVGNVYVITPTATFTCNVKIWGAGGGAANVYTPLYRGTPTGIFKGAGGGAVEGTVTFEIGQPYTIFAGGAGLTHPFSGGEFTAGTAGGGGAASGIYRGNILQLINSGATLTTSNIAANVVLAAGGGAGAGAYNAGNNTDDASVLPGAGGGQVGDRSLLGTPTYITKSTSGISLSSGSWFNGQAYTDNRKGGSGGTIDANIDYIGMSMIGGNSYISDSIDGIISSRSVTGTYGVPGLYDNNYKGTGGDSNRPGRVVLYLDEYRTTSIVATGGDVTAVPIPGYELQYKYHTFTANGKFAVNSTVSTDSIDVFVVGAGGGGGSEGGAGGGGVLVRTGLQITTGNYLVHIGSGGSSQNSLSSDIGGYWGGYPGDYSAFYTNTLSQYFPDNYCRLIYSFNTAVYFISANGDDTTADGSFAAPFGTITGAFNKTNGVTDLIVYAVLPGTYNPPDSAMITTTGYTQIWDHGFPRVWVCSPGKVTITFTNNVPLGTYDNYSEPCVIFDNPNSAVYGAIFERSTGPENSVGNPIFKTTVGLVQNCVFKDTGPWALISRVVNDLRVVNSVVYTSGNSIQPKWNSGRGEDSGDQAQYIKKCLLQNCAFNYLYTTSLTTNFPTVDNVSTNLRANINASTYKITNVTDKGVYAGPYGWGGLATKPDVRSVALTYVAPGGGGGGNTQSYSSRVNTNGGSSGGGGEGGGGRPGLVYQNIWLSNISVASYGNPGGYYKNSSAGGAGGGGAGFPGITVDSSVSGISEGGLGIEWPYGSQVYYGSGGNGKKLATNFTYYGDSVAHGAGRGGNAESSGSNGLVIVRYVTPGPYTPPAPIVRTENLVAIGGVVTITNGYKQHVFSTSGTFSIRNIPDNMYLDIITVGGGRGGNASKGASVNSGGSGGQVSYQRLELNPTSIYNYAVTVGAGGQGGSTSTNSSYYSDGVPGSPSSIILPSYTTVLAKISAEGATGSGNAQPGSLVTSGLFSDNTNYYGGGGANGASGTFVGGIGGGGNSNGGYGTPGTGGGGGGGAFGNYENYYIGNSGFPYYNAQYSWRGGFSYGGYGGSGIVIIRYPYNPI